MIMITPSDLYKLSLIIKYVKVTVIDRNKQANKLKIKEEKEQAERFNDDLSEANYFLCQLYDSIKAGDFVQLVGDKI